MNAKGKSSKGASEKNHPIWVAVIGASAVAVAALITGFFTVVYPNLIVSQHPVKLKSFYSGTAKGYANSDIEFTQVSEDGQGNVSLVVNFTIYDTGKKANYDCQGQATNDRITLKCTQVDASYYTLDINGSIFSDRHMEGSLSATDTFNPNYHHVYSWNVS
jgi:hypothetical protein